MVIRRCAIAVVGVSVAMAALAASAWACNHPTLQAVEPSSAQAGDQVSYTIINTSPGASYVVSINGQGVVDSGKATDSYVAGKFTMPDIGPAATTVSVEAVVTHDDMVSDDGSESYPSSYALAYRPRAAAPGPAPSAGTGASAPSAPSPPAAQSQPGPATSPSSGGGSAGPAGPRPPHSGNPAGPRPHPSSPRSSHTSTPSLVRAAAPVRSTAASTSVRVDGRMRQFVPVHGRADPVRPRTHAEVVSTHVPQEGAAAGNSRSGPRSATVDGRAIDESGTLLVVVALIALLGGSGRAGIRSIRRVPAPIAPDGTTAVAPREESDAIEAELQEIIAEEHSRPRVPL